MASQTFPTTNAGNTSKFGSSVSWTNPTRAELDDSLYATVNWTLSSTPVYKVALVKGGTKGTTEYTGTPSSSEGNIVIGGPTDLWGLTLARTDINYSNFGCAIYVLYDTKGGTDAWSDYLWCDTFDFYIPYGRTILGVEVTIKSYVVWTRPSTYAHYINYVTMTVYYSDLTAGSAQGIQSVTSLSTIGFS